METPTGAPQFDTAEFASPAAGDHCNFCSQPIGGIYYRVNGAMACGSCADKAQRELPKSQHAAFVRAFIFGAAAAVLGLIIYAAVTIITGWILSLVSFAVGYLVGKAMMKGSRGLGGRRYQLTAVLLTYMAVSMAAIPIAIAQYAKQPKTNTGQTQTAPATQHQAPAAPDAAPQTTTAQPAQPPAQAKPAMTLGRALATLAVLGLISPFLALESPLHGVIGLVILFVGIQIAWKITAGTAKVEVSGPFETGKSAAGAS